MDHHGIFRHRIPELCGVSGIGFFLFGRFHIMNEPRPTFAPDFDDPECTEFGRRIWYNVFLFPGKGEKAMSYDSACHFAIQMDINSNEILSRSLRTC